MGGGGPEAFTARADQARQAGRAGAPPLAALACASLGDDAEALAAAAAVQDQGLGIAALFGLTPWAGFPGSGWARPRR